MSLEQFMTDFLNRPVSSLRAIEHRNSGNRTSTILSREGKYQCELISWGPNLVLPAHRHPGMRGIARHIDGAMTFIVGTGKTEKQTNELIAQAKVWPSKFYRNRVIEVNSNTWHGGKTGKGGAAFWIFEEWKGDVQTAGTDWEGPELPGITLSKICV
jgi:hypothetical protein